MRFRRKKIIIGVHGIGNKPAKPLLQKWWIKSINNGLESIGSAWIPYNFEMSYWGDLMHPEPQKLSIKDKKHPLFIERPYVRPAKIKKPQKKQHILRKKILDKLEKKLDSIFYKDHIFINYDIIADMILRRLFKDLDFYYHKMSYSKKTKDVCAKDAIREKLYKTLKKHKKKNIMLITHSMGTIVAYDVLCQLAGEMQISTLITLGSPLGFPVLKKKILKEHNIYDDTKIATPESIRYKWFNFSDIHDKIALVYKLGDEFKENSCKVKPVDYFVNNTYEYNGVKNHHKSYGYLRTPEVSETIHEFLIYKKFNMYKYLESLVGSSKRNYEIET